MGEVRVAFNFVLWVILGWKVSLSFKNNKNRRGLDGDPAGHEVQDRSTFKGTRDFAGVKGRENGNTSIFWRESWGKGV